MISFKIISFTCDLRQKIYYHEEDIQKPKIHLTLITVTPRFIFYKSKGYMWDLKNMLFA